MNLSFETPVSEIPLVGKTRATMLERLGIQTVKDFLYHIPFRYNDYSLVTPIAKAQPGETVTIKGTVTSMKTFITKNGKRLIEGKVSDDTGIMTIIWFNQQYLLRVIHEGDIVSFSGPVTWFGRKVVLSNPQFEILSTQGEDGQLHTGRIVPVYSETEGITSKWLRNKIHALLHDMRNQIHEYLPPHICSTYNLMPLPDALSAIHFPNSLEEAASAKRRLAFDELLVLHVKAQMLKRQREQSQKGIPIHVTDTQKNAFIDALPFSLTDDQHTVINELMLDLQKHIPMNRLVVGDVGSGKTIIAAFAMYALFVHGYSSILMAPTQILAEQHHKTLSRVFERFDIKVDLVTGSSSTIDMFSGQTKIIVGTHAVLTNQKKLGDNVGLVVIDEQHRFGVKQRSALIENNNNSITPHLLTMTATPIPRTIAKTFFGDIDVSFLFSSPSGRKPVKTWLVPNEKREKAYDWIQQHIQNTGSQAFIICPLIESSDNETLISVKAVTEEYTKLQEIFSEFSIGLLHGRMKPKEKTTVLEEFLKKTHHILLATPVVEVGIDIPNATIIVIEAADRFGLGQLHQLRGRVGRGDKQSYCLLFTDVDDEHTLKRLKAMETIYSGPQLAELDLRLRGAGDIFGTRQHGFPMLKIATFSDMKLLDETRQAAASLLDNDPHLDNVPVLREAIKHDIMTSIPD
ncbi:MAG: ATP-dependent DNA helicase RecG [Patescibacteria group bacterium]|nr:ATP-dependent DNA helicase RecG [Patescibacteria group bacterium]